jgi:hypothetical protein
VFGLWTCHQYIGDIAAALASGYLLHNGYDYRWCLMIPAVINGIWAFVNFFRVPNTPEEFGVETEASKQQKAAASRGAEVEGPAPIGFIQAFLLPNVMNYAVAFGFFKLVSQDQDVVYRCAYVHSRISFSARVTSPNLFLHHHHHFINPFYCTVLYCRSTTRCSSSCP